MRILFLGLTAAIMFSMLPVRAEVEAVEFLALAPDAAMSSVQESGLMGGYPDGKFHAERGLTRAELASILNKTFKLSQRDATVKELPAMKDVPENYWAAGDINLAVSRGIMRGYRDGFFHPEHRVSRAEALAILAQAYGVYQFDDLTVTSILSHYPDSGQIPDWARKAMATSLKYGFVDVAPSSKLRPLQPMTRGDMAYALGQYLDRLHKSEQQTLH